MCCDVMYTETLRVALTLYDTSDQRITAVISFQHITQPLNPTLLSH